MMSRRILAALTAMVLSSGAVAYAQSSPRGSSLATEQFQLASTGSSPVLSLTGGQSVCSVVVSSTTPFSGLTMVPQVSSDGPNNPQTWVTAPLSGVSAINTTGTYVGNISSYGTTNFRVNITALASGTVSGVVNCSASVGGETVNIGNVPVPVQTPSANSTPFASQPVLSYGMGQYQSTPPSLTNGLYAPIQLDSAGNIKVSGSLNGTTTQPYTMTADAQAATAASSIGIVGLNNAGTVDRIRVGNAGSAITASTPGVQYMQGVGPNGATTTQFLDQNGAAISWNFPTGFSGRSLPTQAFLYGLDNTGTVQQIRSAPAGTNTTTGNILVVQGANGGVPQPSSISSNPCSSSNSTLVNAAVNTSSASTSQIVAVSGTTKVYVCKVVLLAAGATNVTLETGSGTACATSTVALTGPMPLAAQAGWVEPSGIAPNYVSVAGNALCLVNSAAVQVSGSIEYVQQ